DPDVLYLSTAGGGVWKTYNARSSVIQWEPLTDALGTTAVGTLAMDPSNPEMLFLSIDGGATWGQVPLSSTTPGYFYMWSLAYAGGDTWLATGQAGDPTVPPVPNNAGTLGLWRSTDDGATWTYIAGVLPISDPLVPAAGRATLASAQSTLSDPATARVYLLAARKDG